MKLPRWLQRILLSVSMLGVVVVAAWWWITWPDRTARRFVSFLCCNRVQDAANLVITDPTYSFVVVGPAGWSTWELEQLPEHCDHMHVQVIQRSFQDMLLGRVHFKLFSNMQTEIIADRDKIRFYLVK